MAIFEDSELRELIRRTAERISIDHMNHMGPPILYNTELPSPGIDLDGRTITPEKIDELEKSEASKVSDMAKFIKQSKPAPRYHELIIGPDYTHVLDSSQSYFDIFDSDDGEPIRRRNGVLRTNVALRRMFDIQNNVQKMTLNPANCRFKAENKSKVIYVLEDPPAVRSVQFSLPFSEEVNRYKKQGRYEQYKAHIDEILNNPGSYSQSGSKYETFTIDLQFPYFIYVVELCNSADQEFGFRSLKVFARHAPLSSLSDPLYRLPLTNVDSTVCLGNLGTDDAFKPEDGIYTPQHTINNVLMSWWSNIFNTDLSGAYEWYLNHGDTPYSGILAWHYFSMTDPMFIYSAKMKPSTERLNNIINGLYNTSDRDEDDDNRPSILFTSLHNMISRSASTKSADKVDVMYGNNISISGEYIEIGDDVLIDDVTYYLDSAAYNVYNGKRLYVKFEGENGEIMTWNWDDNLNDYVRYGDDEKSIRLSDHFKSPLSKTLEEVNIKGVMVKVDDIVKVNMVGSSTYDKTPLFTKITGIRIARDGKIEIKFLNGHYLLDGIEVEKMNMDLIEVDPSLTLVKDKLYFVTERGRSNSPFYGYTFTGGYVSGSTIYAKFERVDREGNLELRLNTLLTEGYQIIQPDSESIYPMIRAGNYVKLERFYQYCVNPKIAWCKLPAINSSDNYIRNIQNIPVDSDVDKQLYKFMFDTMLKSDAVDIKGFDHDIHFKIGDEVVYCDWRRPESLLEIKTIVDFMSDDNYLSFILRDEKGNEIAYPYIDYDDGYIEVGRIRKVRREMNGFRRGMRVKATEPRMPQFLKSGSFQIEYFVETDGTPLIMFNNLCTQWLDTRFSERFELILETDKRYNKLKLTPFNEEKFVFQPGDFISYITPGSSGETNKLTMCVTAYNGSNLQIRSYRSKLNASDGTFVNRKSEMNRRYMPYGILGPRIAQSNFNVHSNASRFVTFWNSDFESTRQGVYMQMPNEARTIYQPIEFRSTSNTPAPPETLEFIDDGVVDIEEVIEQEDVITDTEEGIFDDLFEN